MLKRLIVCLFLSLAGLASPAEAQTVRDQVIAELRADGYTAIRMSRTWLGRIRFVARRDGAEREIVVNPVTGVILRDYVRRIDDGAGGDDDGPEDRNGDEDEDDGGEDDDDDDDDGDDG